MENGRSAADPCHKPVSKGGFPVAYLFDAPGISVERQLSFGEDQVTVTEAGDNLSLTGSNKGDTFIAAAGHDTTYMGGNGDDVLTGGNGPDTFVITADSGRDTITDCRPNLDHIVVGYAGNGSAADLNAWLKDAHNGAGFSFADVDTDGNGQADG